MPINITMPALSPTMEEGNLAKWLVKEGDKVAPGDVIAEIETDKATMEVEAVDEGTVAKIMVPAGAEGVKVNAVIAVLIGEDEDAAGAALPDAWEAGKVTASAVAPVPARGEASAKQQETVAASGYGGSAELGAEKQDATGGDAGNGASRVFASPLARRIAREAGIDLARVNGTGPHGRVVKADVDAAKAAPAERTEADQAPRAAAPSSAPPKSAPEPSPQTLQPASDAAVLRLFPEGSFDLVPHDTMRKTIARRLVEAKQTVPHFYLTLDCDLDALFALRAAINAAAPLRKTDKGEVPAYKASVNDMVVKALALSLRDVPDANVSWTQGAMVRHRHVDVGVAVSIPGGLITPIIRRAEEKTLSAIAAEMKDLAGRARSRKLKPEEYQGGTTAVSNLGMFGVKSFSAVINPPHATILAVGAGEQRAVVRKGAVVAATVMSVTLSSDHRAVDGALGAELMQAFRNYVENPMGMLV